MSHSTSTVNVLIHDSHGNPQYVKIQPNQAGKTMKPIPQETVKALLQSQKAQVVATSPGTVISSNAQVLRTLSIGKPKQLVTIPVQSPLHTIIKQEPSPSTSPKSTSSPSIILQGNNQKQYVTVLDSSNSSKKRQEIENDTIIDYDFYSPPPVSSSKRRKTEKGGKGLRHFSMKVCEKVRSKGTTSYNEVADELVAEFTNPNLVPNSVDQQYDQKNIRRRVYDALNVLMAMNIISKEKKEIKWLGLPTNTAQECVSLTSEKKVIAERIKRKTHKLNELLLKQISIRSLIQRNYELEKTRGAPAPNTAMHLPFIVVNSDRKTVIDCSITNDKTEYQFIFNGKFEINDHVEVLKFIGLTYGLEKGTISEANLEKVKNMLPKSLEKYILKMASEPMVDNGYDTCATDYGAGPSSDISYGQEEDSHLETTSDEESMASTDLDIN